MAKRQKLSPKTDDCDLDGFAREVELALDHFADAEWLGVQSPLAAPYFLGRLLDSLAQPLATAPTPLQRGQALQSVLQASALNLDEDLRELARVSFFERNLRFANIDLAMELHLSERTYYRYRIRAIQELASALNHSLPPTLRSESPNHKAMIGRASVLTDCLSQLRTGASVCITGVSGTGKTTLGAAIARAWGLTHSSSKDQMGSNVFWLTLRPGLTDHLAGFVFALGYFLRGQGASNTWRQLIADQGAIKRERILGLLRYDLAQLKASPPLVCIDEADLLQQESSEHAQIIYLLEELRAAVTLVLIGQRAIIETDHHHTLRGLNDGEFNTLLEQAGLTSLAATPRAQLLSFTRGNPAMLTLFVALNRVGSNVEEALRSLSSAPSLEALFNRIWRYLSDAEHVLMMQLSVFRGMAPQDSWANEQTELSRLQQRELLQTDDVGGICLLPHIHTLTQDRIPAELKPVLHLNAARICEARSEYIEAMHHYIEGRQPALAVWLWFVHVTGEIECGRANAGMNLLKRISPDDLPNQRDRDVLRAARGSLLQFLGKADEADTELSRVSTADIMLQAHARLFQGTALEEQGQAERALERYRSGLDALVRSPQFQKVRFHTRMSHLYTDQLSNLAKAKTEALSARLEAAIFAGNVEERTGNYALAKTRFEEALAMIAGVEGFLLERSRLYQNLGILLWHRGNIDEAVIQLRKAIECDKTRGDVVNEAYDQINLASAYIVGGQYEQGLAEASVGLNIAEALGHNLLIADLTACAAEAYYFLGRHDEAEQYAWRSLTSEEERSRPYALTVLGLVRHAQHNFAEAAKLLKEAIASAQASEDKYAEAAAWRALGDACHDEPNPTAAHEAYASSLKLYQFLGLEKEIGELSQMLI